jgi:hypothetical protein
MAQSFCTLTGAELPHQVRALVEKRQSAINKINLAFIQELEKIKVDYTKAGDLENANLVAGLITQTAQNDPNSELIQGGFHTEASLKEQLVGKWLIYDTKYPRAWSGVVTINKDLHYSCEGTMGTPNNQSNSGKIRINKNKIILGLYDFDSSSFSSGKLFSSINGDPRTLERMK